MSFVVDSDRFCTVVFGSVGCATADGVPVVGSAVVRICVKEEVVVALPVGGAAVVDGSCVVVAPFVEDASVVGRYVDEERVVASSPEDVAVVTGSCVDGDKVGPPFVEGPEFDVEAAAVVRASVVGTRVDAA